jgi:vitamin B12 transporter
LESIQETIMKPQLIRAALFGVLSLPLTAKADPPLEMLIVTPTRMAQPLDSTIADTTVLNEQDIRNSGAPDVPALLRSLPGVEVVQSGGLGSVSSIFMRGTNSDHVLVLLDGVRIDSATSGTTALEHIMLDSIERIEVVRGNASSLYGSEAIGGVIQLFTKQGKGVPAFNASAGAGSHDTQHLAAGFSGAVQDTSFSVNAGKIRTDGVSAINPLLVPGVNPNNNGYDNDTLSAQVKHALNADHALSASLFSTRGNTSFDNPYNLAVSDVNNTVANIDKLALSSDDQLGESWHSQVRLAQGIDDSHTYLNGAPAYRYQTRNNQLAWQNNLKITDSQHVDLAAEYLDQSVSSDTLYTQTSRTVSSLLGGYVGEFGAQQIQFNLRQDDYSDFGTANTGLLGYGAKVTDALRLTATISTAFKAPTFNDLYYPLQNYGAYGSYVGNPNLRPERSQNREAGLHYAANGQRIDAVYFDNRIRDLIEPDNLFAGSVINIDQAQITGQELNYAGDFGNTHLKASATFQNPRNTTTGQVLLRRARQYGNFAASHDWDAWKAGAELRYSGTRQDFDLNGNPVTLPGYQLLNLTSGYKLDRNFDLSMRLDNLFNRDYSEAYGYNTLGRTLFVGLSYQQ